MADVFQSTAQAGDKVSRFGDALGKWSEGIAASGPRTAYGIESILGHARDMQESILALRSQLDESRDEIEELRREVITARAEARIDGLTRLMNRRGFEMEIAACWNSSTK